MLIYHRSGSTSKTLGSQQILKETSTNDNIDTVIHREQDLGLYILYIIEVINCYKRFPIKRDSVYLT